MVQRALNVMTWKNDFQEPIEMLNEAIRRDNTCEFAYETLATIEIQRFDFEILKKINKWNWFINFIFE